MRMAANLEGKTPEHNLLIVGGGEIDGGRDSASSRSGLSSAFEVQDGGPHSQVDRQRSEAAIFETPRSRAQLTGAKHSSLLNIASALSVHRTLVTQQRN